MSTLCTSVQVITKNKSYYLKTNLGLMKIRGEVSTATPRSEFEEMFERRRKPENTEIYTLYRHIPSKFWHTAAVAAQASQCAGMPVVAV